MSIAEFTIHRITKLNIGPIVDGQVDDNPKYYHRKIIITVDGPEQEIEFSLFSFEPDGLSLRL